MTTNTIPILIKKVPKADLEKIGSKTRLAIPRAVVVRAAIRTIANLPPKEFERIIFEQQQIEQART
jgi:hypothetical protein